MSTDTLKKTLGNLRHRLRAWLVLRGVAMLAATVTALVFLSLLVDRLARLDLAQRGVLLAVMLAVVGYVLIRYLLRPLLHTLSEDGLCLQVEARAPELKSILISALQIDRTSGASTAGVSTSLAGETIRAGEQAAAKLKVANFINQTGRRRNVALLSATLAVLACAALAFPSTMRTWFSRNVRLSNVSWPRETTLTISGVVDGRLGVPVGDDLMLRVDADPGGVVPRRVTARHRPLRGGRGDTRAMAMIGGNHFQLEYEAVREPFLVRVHGNDHRTDWVTVEPLERPEVLDLRFIVRPPAYVGTEQRELPTGQSAYRILAGSALTVKATVSHPLREVTLARNDAPVRSEPLRNARSFAVELAPTELQDGRYALQLRDRRDITLQAPLRFTVRLVEDRTPDVRLDVTGVGALVLAGAVLPVEVSIEDDFDVASTRLLCTTVAPGEEEEGGAKIEIPGLAPLVDGPAAEVRHDSSIELSQLALVAGTELMIRLEADDNDTRTGPKTGSSSTVSLSVVTPEELAQYFLRREQELHQQFSRIVRDQVELNEQTRIAAARLGREEDGGTAAPSLAEQERTQRSMASRLSEISEQFRRMIAEIRNNRLESRGGPTQTRWERDIIAPLDEVADPWVPRAVEHLRDARQATEAEMAGKALERAKKVQAEILSRMKRVETNMTKAETLQEAISMLRNILRKQRELREQTEDERSDVEESVFD